MRKGMSQGIARPDYFDRNPVNRSLTGGVGNGAPHTVITRWTYTVAAGKKAIIDELRTSIIRAGVAGAVGMIESAINYTPSGGSAITVCDSLLTTNAINDNTQQTITNAGIMLAGDTIAGADLDPSTGGTASMTSSAKLFEFDA